MKNSIKACGITLLAASLFSACSRESSKTDFASADPLEIEARIKEIQTGKECTIEEMKADDIIVAVNGFPYRRKWYDKQVNLIAKQLLARNRNDPQQVVNAVNVRKRQLIRDFVMKRLMIDDARKKKLMTLDELKDGMRKHFDDVAKASHKTTDEMFKKLGDDRKYYEYEVAERLTVDDLVAKKIPPLATVDDAFVAKVQQQVKEENDAATASNALFKAEMGVWKREIEAGKTTFEDVAQRYSQEYNGEKAAKDGYWGEFEKGSMDSRVVDQAVFKMKRGEISDPLEDDNGYHLVKVLEVIPEVKNEKGRVIERQRRKLAHVYMEKLPIIIVQTDKEMFKDLKVQMQMQAINFYVDYLKTNGVNKVVYPHGENLFK